MASTYEEIMAKAHELYGAGDVAGAKSMLQGEGFDGQLHPRLAAVVNRLEAQRGDVSLADMEILRRVASNAAESIQPDERRLASKLIDKIDDAVDGMGGGSAALREARDVWARLRRMSTCKGVANEQSKTA